MDTISVVLVDDHKIIRQGIYSLLSPHSYFGLAGEASTGADALELVGIVKPDIVVVDFKLPDMTGAELCRRILKLSPETKVLILSAFFDQHLVAACFQAGAKGYLIKDSEHLDLPNALLDVYNGHSVFDPRVADMLTEIIQKRKQSSDVLSLRELDVIHLISQGLTNREIANQLQLTENTVKGYVKQIFVKLGARNRVEAVALARKQSIL